MKLLQQKKICCKRKKNSPPNGATASKEREFVENLKQTYSKLWLSLWLIHLREQDWLPGVYPKVDLNQYLFGLKGFGWFWFCFDTKHSKSGGFAQSWGSGEGGWGLLLRPRQLHVGPNGTHVSWSVCQQRTPLICECQNLNNKCSGMANCSESSQGQRRTIEAVSPVSSTQLKRGQSLSSQAELCEWRRGALKRTLPWDQLQILVFFGSIFDSYYLWMPNWTVQLNTRKDTGRRRCSHAPLLRHWLACCIQGRPMRRGQHGSLYISPLALSYLHEIKLCPLMNV